MAKQGYILRYYLPVKPHFDEEFTEKRFVQLIEFCKATDMQAVMFYVALNPNWYYMPDTPVYARQVRDIMLPYIKRLRAEGIGYQLNFQDLFGATLGGTDFDDYYDWENLVDQRGRAAKGCGCPLGKKFRAQAKERLRIWAETEPDIIWIDDDFRMHNHGTPIFSMLGGEGNYPDHYCYCDEHIRLFNEKNGGRFTRKDLVAHITAAGEPSPVRAKYQDFLYEIMDETADWIRKTVHSTSPETRLAIMTSVPDTHSAEGRRWGSFLKALSGDYAPIIRPHFGPYKEGDPREFVLCYRMLAQTMENIKQGYAAPVEYCPEVENTRYTVWSKSAAATSFQLVLSAFEGCKDVTLAIHDLDGGLLDDEPFYKNLLIHEKPLLDEIVFLDLGRFSNEGVIIPTSVDSGKTCILNKGEGYPELQGAKRNIDEQLLKAGIPCCYRSPSETHSGIVALDGYTTAFLSDEDILSILKGKVILEGNAMSTLCERGFSEYIGVKVLEEQRMYVNNESLKSVVRKDGTPIRIPLRTPGGCWYSTEPDPKATVLSELQAPTGELFAGFVLFENALGGTVLSYPIKNNWGDGFYTHHRAAFLKKLLSDLDNDLPRIDCLGYMLSVVKKGDGGKRYYLVANLAADVVNSVGINGQDVDCDLSVFGTAVFVEENKKIRLVGKTRQGRYS